MSARTRDEHLAWAKNRALEYLDQGDLRNAFATMASDLSKHPELNKVGQGVLNQTLAGSSPPLMLGLLHVMNRDARELRRWIEGFN